MTELTATEHYLAVRDLIGAEDMAKLKLLSEYLAVIPLTECIQDAAGVLMDILEPGRIAPDGSYATLDDILERAVKADLTIWVYYETMGECDYSGQDVATALTHIRNCDEMQVTLEDRHGTPVAWMLCVQQGPDSDPAEEIADCSGPWLERIGYVS